jgi:ribonuclease R
VIKALLAGKRYNLPNLPAPTQALEKFEKRLESNRNRAAAHQSSKKSTTYAEQSVLLSRKVAAPLLTSEPLAKDVKGRKEAWEAAGLHCSANERRADEASRDVEAWLKCYYMQSYLGEEFIGTVAGVTPFGLFVVLDSVYVEGLVHITELSGDYYQFDEPRQELRGERTGRRYKLGDKLQVQVSRVDLDARKIDFRLLDSGDERSETSKRIKMNASESSGIKKEKEQLRANSSLSRLAPKRSNVNGGSTTAPKKSKGKERANVVRRKGAKK